MTVPDGAENWRTSSYSGQGQDCVEVRLGPDVGVRDTKNRAGGELDVAPAAWRSLTDLLR
jgi:hypothetical protein